jgi:hypothetical protein
VALNNSIPIAPDNNYLIITNIDANKQAKAMLRLSLHFSVRPLAASGYHFQTAPLHCII